MRSLLYLTAAIIILSIAACGPSAEEKAKMEAEETKAKMDSMFEAARQSLEETAEAADTVMAATPDTVR